MIDFLRGFLIDLAEAECTLLTPGGIGYRVHLMRRDADRLAGTVADPSAIGAISEPGIGLWVHERRTEDSVDLFGFLYRYDRIFFRWLLPIQGLGAKLALALTDQRDMVRIGKQDDLRKIAGLGPKRVAMLLAHMATTPPPDLDGTPAGSVSQPLAVADPVRDGAMLALQGLGYSSREARAFLDAARPHSSGREQAHGLNEDQAISELVRAALAHVARP